jgi:hypothetical protein
VRTDAPRFAEYQAAVNADNKAFWTMVKAEGLRLATDKLAFFAHWITPEEQPYRYDTRFFAAPMPDTQTPVPDPREVVELRWYAPRAALEAFTQGEISLRNPTVQNMKLADGPSVKESIERLREREVPTIRPRVIMEDGKRRVLMPGEPGYY